MNFLEENKIDNIDIKANKQSDFSISTKKGFSVLIWKESLSDEACIKILTKKIFEIKESDNIEVKKAFALENYDNVSKRIIELENELNN